MRDAQEKEGQREDLARGLKQQEFELEKLKRLLANREEEAELERRRLASRYDRKCEEQERERAEWAELYQQMQGELMSLKQHQVHDGRHSENLGTEHMPSSPGLLSGRGRNDLVFNSRSDIQSGSAEMHE